MTAYTSILEQLDSYGDNGKRIKETGESHLDSLVPNWCKTSVSMGTTLMALEYDGGIIIGADTRTSMGTFVMNRVSDKLTKLTDRIYCCRSGSSADTQAVAAIIKYRMAFHEMETGEPPLVKVAANSFRDICYEYRDQLTAGIICAGWDKREGGQIYMLPLGGMLLRSPVALAGSGSTYIVGFVDSNYKKGMKKEEARELVLKSISLAISRDGASGGCVRLADINEKGVDREDITYHNLPRFFEP
ncbi:proteasome beta1 subunit [Brevipalpus obovatus]|uniref:proteasome beta1 subunit n=1 Tax=Brevipalpus obovatus TaxID=246614 RepID=UPI003D9E93B3